MQEAVITDEQILELIRVPATLDHGFRLLLKKYQERLYWHIRHMVGNHEDADDVFQNSMIKAFRGISRFEQKSSLYTWLYRIVTNEAISFLNQRKHQHTSPMEGDEYLMQQIPADSPMDGDALHAKLIQAMRQLPDKQRQVFILRYYEEMSYQDMSRVLDTSEGALKASFHHAVKKVEQFFRELG